MYSFIFHPFISTESSLVLNQPRMNEIHRNMKRPQSFLTFHFHRSFPPLRTYAQRRSRLIIIFCRLQVFSFLPSFYFSSSGKAQTRRREKSERGSCFRRSRHFCTVNSDHCEKKRDRKRNGMDGTKSGTKLQYAFIPQEEDIQMHGLKISILCPEVG